MSSGDTLRGHDLFRSLTVEEAHRLSSFSAVKEYDTDQTVFECGKMCTHIFMLMKGSISLNLPADPPDSGIVVSQIEVGELFGLSPLLDAPRYTTSAHCTGPTTVLAIEARPFRELLKGNSTVAIDVLNRVARIYYSRYLGVLRNLQAVVKQIPLAR